MDKKSLIKRFTQEGYTLRPECLNHLTEYFSQLKIQNNKKSINNDVVESHMDKIIENVKVLQTHQGDIILNEQTVKGAIELLQRPTNNNNNMEIEEEIQTKSNKKHSILKHNNNDHDDVDNEEQKKEQQVNDIINQKYLNTIVILDTFKETPRLVYNGNKVTNEFIINMSAAQSKKKSITLGEPQDKVNLYKMRFNLIRSKLASTKKYTFFGNNEDNKQKQLLLQQQQLQFEMNNENINKDQEIIEICDVGQLIVGKSQEMVTFGMIYEGCAGEYFIQDELTRVKLDIKNAVVESGYVTASSIVLAKGIYDQMRSVFAVSSFILPQYNNSPTQLSSNYNIFQQDFFGTKAKTQRILGKLIQLEIESAQIQKKSNSSRSSNLTRFQKERQLELGIFDLELNPYYQKQDQEEYCIVIFSDFSLSNRSTLKKFESILQVYEQQLKPLIIILMGQFFNVSEILSEQVSDEIKEALNDFQIILNKFKSLRDNCYWIMIPHINDIGSGPIQPKCELPEEIFSEIKQQIPYFKLAQNPCRLSVFGKTFLIQRNDQLRELRKKQIVINPHNDIQLNYVQTILSQRHLSPLPLLLKPTLWNYDNCFQFYDNPDYLILSDSYCDQFDFIIEDKIINNDDTNSANNDIIKEKPKIQKTFVINPGNFEKKSTFTVIYPVSEITQSSSI